MKYLLYLILIAVLAAAGYAAWMWYSITQPYQDFPKESVFVDIPHGASPRFVGYLLKHNGVVRSKLAFEIYARRHPKRTLQAGEYFFDHAMSGRDVFWKIAAGQIFEQPFTVREGETMFEIARELEAGKLMPAGDFLFAASDPSLIRDFAPEARTLEGFLFPATYELPRHLAASELTAQMVHKFKDEWKRIAVSDPNGQAPPNEKTSAKASTGSQGRASSNLPAGLKASTISILENPSARLRIVTLASLVERETPKPEERPMVASVFDNRMRKRMRLQCDPTVIYGLERMGQYKGSLSGKDLSFDSPYNTYEHGGLPPGP
ncbi:MAG TPA: endolytic transglycosylase MltG, partial [Candidatus Dormibacteraeota bacterium]|nr:endolytic transglycosylase MltG [Candidatus Dormibacteraeota bacterium]